MNAYEGWYICKELKKNEQERRAWKQRRYEDNEAFEQLGGLKRLKALQKHKKRRVEKFMNRNSWYDTFSPESMAILNGEKI